MSDGTRSFEKKTEKANKAPAGSGVLPPWLLVVLALCYDALIFCLWTQSRMGAARALTIAVCTLAFALLTALAATIGRSRRVHLILAAVICSFWALFYLLEYFLLDAFKNFFTLSEIFSAGENAGQEDFSARVWDLIRSDFWRIPVMALPMLVYGAVNSVTRRPRRHTAGVRRYLFVVGLALAAAAGFFSLFISPDTKKLRDEYNFTEAVDSFGLPMGLLLDRLNAGGSQSGFIIDSGAPRDWESEASAPVSTSPPPETVLPSRSDPLQETQAETDGSTEPSETSVEATDPTEPAAPQRHYNMMQINFRELAREEPDQRIAAVHTYADSLAPSRTNEMTGRFAGKNLIFITAEAFSLEVIDPELTPTLYRMATKGIHFTDYYQPAWGGSTSTGEFTNLIGIIPTDGVKSMTHDTIGMNLYFTMGNQLQRLGYFSRGYHNNSYTYYNRDNTHENLGYEKWIGMGNGMEEGVQNIWPESDREMIDFTIPQYIDQQPFSIYYMTVSGHGNYSWTGNSMSNKNREAVSDLSCSETVKAYLAANLELEYAMADLLAALEEAGIADDTVIVLGADHYPYGLDSSVTWGNDENYLEELYGCPCSDCFIRDHNALIIWSGCIEDEGIEVDTPVYSLDILPTLSNLFGLEYDSRLLVGRDVFSSQQPLAIWINHSWKTELGSYDASTGVFTPAEGAEIPEGYQERISNLVQNKFSFSEAVLKFNYYGILFDE